MDRHHRRRQLDGLRGVAIGFVVLRHALPDRFTGAGTVGVLLFFVLSSYLITGLLLDEHQQQGRIDLPQFYTRRALRLLPALATVLVAYLAAVALVPGVTTTMSDAVRGVLLGASHVMDFAKALRGGGPDELSHLWTLSVEEQFYLVWPAALWLALRRRGPREVARTVSTTCVLLLAIGPVYAFVVLVPSTDAYFLPTTWCGSFAAGAAAAFVRAGYGARSVRWTRRLAQAPTAFVSALVLLLFACSHGTAFRPFSTLVAVPLLNLCAVSCLLHVDRAGGSAAQRWLSVPAFVSAGAVSYSLYLLNLPVILLAEQVFGEGTAVRLAAAVVAVGLAIVCRRLVEVPVLRLRSRVVEAGGMKGRSLNGIPPHRDTVGVDQ